MEADGTIPGTTGGLIAAWTTSQAGTNDQAAELPALQTFALASPPISDQAFPAFNAVWEGLVRSWQDALAVGSPGDGPATAAFGAPLSAGGPGFNMSPVVLPSPADGGTGTGVEPTLPPAMAMFWQQGG